MNHSTSPLARVIVEQAGARHNYAIPAAFAAEGMLEAFYTDMCAGLGLGAVIEKLPAAVPLPKPLRALQARKLPDSIRDRTRTDDINAVRFELEARRAPSADERVAAMVRYDERHGRKMAEWGLGRATHLFTCFGGGGALIQLARQQGIPVLTDVIIALSTDRIFEAEHKAFPEWGPPPRQGTTYRADSLVANTDVFVCPSAFVADDLVEHWGVARQQTRIIPYALPSSWFDLAPQPVPGRVLFVGSADLRKGIHYLAMAAELLLAKNSGFEFRVAGGVASEVLQQPLARHLNFLGRVPRTKVQQEFEKADVFVLPTLAEGSATVIYEAMAAGLPVVTTHAAGSLVRDGIEGFIVPERDPDAVALAVEEIVSDRSLRSKMSAAATARAKISSWDRYRVDLINLVQQLPNGQAQK